PVNTIRPTTVFHRYEHDVAATVEVHPSHVAAAGFVDENCRARSWADYQPAVCREFLVVLTRQPVSGRVFTVTEAVAALGVWQTGCRIIGDDESVIAECI